MLTDILAERTDAPISELVPILEERAPLAPLHLIDRRRLTGYVAMAISAETALLNQIARKATDNREAGMSGEETGRACFQLCEMRRCRQLGGSVTQGRHLGPTACEDVDIHGTLSLPNYALSLTLAFLRTS